MAPISLAYHYYKKFPLESMNKKAYSDLIA